MSCFQLGIVLLFCLPLAACLTCYTCMFPAISPLDCFQFPQECPAGQRCLSSTATGRRVWSEWTEVRLWTLLQLHQRLLRQRPVQRRRDIYCPQLERSGSLPAARTCLLLA
ncbi:hypothetical protein KUCAC02_010752 [Chaenocephalus aceratus]|uniref:Uncharacterized protein n=1 Tax=Chaenocephalus aceratus TaxID=36190 RepID=A0ACB9WUP5_CHAAC|nr:hypothetical protein KUCAC02_010752 [Chaenocephalus aceratus]